MKNVLFIFLCSIVFIVPLFGQNQEIVVIGDIHLEGNDHTRDFVLKREMDIETGDTLLASELQLTLIRNENHLLNTGLFLSADVDAVEWKRGQLVADINVKVHETWYFFPIPVVKLADRNFNVWWEEYNHDFERLIFGVRGFHFNLTGVRDYLKLIAEFGFRQRYQLRYRYPYLNKDRTLGMEFEFGYSRSRNGAYASEENRLAFLISEQKDNFKSFFVDVSAKYRPEYYLSHAIGVAFTSNAISDTVRQLNPGFHLNNSSTQRYFSIYYNFVNDRRNRRLQATSGHYLEAFITQVGFGIYDDLNYGFVSANLRTYVPLHKKITGRWSTTGRVYFNRDKISYNHSQALGYGSQYVRGYEHYVVDGTDYFISHQGLTWEFFNERFNLSKVLPFKKMNVVPLRLFLSANVDIGFVNTAQYAEQITLDDQWLYGYGPSLEILLAEGYLFGIDYSFNHLGESGVFLHTKFNF